MRRYLVAAGLLLAGCDKSDSARAASTAPAARALTAAPIQTFASYDAWCARMGKGCKGEWEGHASGTSALGPYRFVAVEYTGLKDGEGPALDVFLELKTSRGFGYLSLGRTRVGKVTTSVLVKEVVDRPGALELRAVFRTSPRFTFSDYYSTDFIVEGPNGLGVVEVALGKIVGNNDTGTTTGTIGQAQWQAGKVILKGANVADGEWAITLP